MSQIKHETPDYRTNKETEDIKTNNISFGVIQQNHRDKATKIDINQNETSHHHNNVHHETTHKISTRIAGYQTFEESRNLIFESRKKYIQKIKIKQTRKKQRIENGNRFRNKSKSNNYSMIKTQRIHKSDYQKPFNHQNEHS